MESDLYRIKIYLSSGKSKERPEIFVLCQKQQHVLQAKLFSYFHMKSKKHFHNVKVVNFN